MITGLGWDDESDYMLDLKEFLGKMNVKLEVFDSERDFKVAFTDRPQRWDFVVVDLFRGTERVGVELAHFVEFAKRREPWYPIFILTQHPDRFEPRDFNLPPNVTFRYKSDPVWAASAVKEELVQRGVYVDSRKVFQIHCSGEQTYKDNGARLRRRLEQARGLRVEVIGDDKHLGAEIVEGLLRRMNECAAIVAVCTPDDEWKDGTRHPRQNVLLEIGMALGLSRGLDRLIVVKKEGTEWPPSDLGGVLTLNYRDSIDEIFDRLESRLADIGVDFQGHSQR